MRDAHTAILDQANRLDLELTRKSPFGTCHLRLHQSPNLDVHEGLAGMARAFCELTANAEAQGFPRPEWLALLLVQEWSFRHDRKLAARLRFAKLLHQAT